MQKFSQKISLQCTKIIIKFCTSIQNFNNAKKPKNGKFENLQKFHVVFGKNYKMLVVKMHKKGIQKTVFLCKMYKFSKN